MNNLPEKPILDWVPSAYYDSIDVHCPIERAWPILLDYQAWNPDFAGVEVTRVPGTPSGEGEIVLIKDRVPYIQGEPPPEFYAQTVTIREPSQVVWCVFSKEGPEFRNFIDLALTRTSGGVKFEVRYYEQVCIPSQKLAAHRSESKTVYANLVAAFKAYAESAGETKR
jgi:hypothetical protein